MDGGSYTHPQHYPSVQDCLSQLKFDYQDRGIDQIRDRMRQGYRGVTYISPTGSGKSYVAAKIARLTAKRSKQFRYLAPRKLLVSGVSEKLTQYGIEHSVRMDGVGWTGGRKPDTQAWCTPSYFSELNAIKRDRKRLSLGDTETDRALPLVDLFIIDEAHTHQPGICKLWTLYPHSRFIYLTATPLPGMDRFNDAPPVLGPGVGELQRRGILVPVRYKTFEADGEDAEALRGEIVSTWLTEGENRKTVIFCKNRSEAKYIYEKFIIKGVSAEYIDCNTPQTEREAIRERLRSGASQIVVNVEVMGYGVDWPFISCVVLAYVVEAKLQDTVTRLAEYIQKVGRGLRACEGKTDLVVIDHTGTCRLFDPVEADREWEIESAKIKRAAEDEKRRVRDEKETQIHEPKLITCGECGHNFIQLSECPVCGNQVTHQVSSPVEHVDAVIAEVDIKTGRYKPEKVKKQKSGVLPLWKKDEAHEVYAGILWYVRNTKKKNGDSYNDGLAFHIYERLKTGIEAPRPWRILPIEPDAAMKDWIKNAIRSHNAAYFLTQRLKRVV